MNARQSFSSLCITLALLAGCTPATGHLDLPTDTYEDLTAFFEAWRQFRAPARVNGVPDFSEDAISRQWNDLSAWRAAHESFDIDSWPVSHQVDWHLVRAELNGLQFDHEVLKPWERDPAYYIYLYPSPTDVPSREGPMIEGSLEIYYYDYPLSDQDAEHI